jgi:hypothetical protein
MSDVKPALPEAQPDKQTGGDEISFPGFFIAV